MAKGVEDAEAAVRDAKDPDERYRTVSARVGSLKKKQKADEEKLRTCRKEWNEVNSQYEKLLEAYRKNVHDLQQAEAERVQVQAAGATSASLGATLDYFYQYSVASTAALPGHQGREVQAAFDQLSFLLTNIAAANAAGRAAADAAAAGQQAAAAAGQQPQHPPVQQQQAQQQQQQQQQQQL